MLRKTMMFGMLLLLFCGLGYSSQPASHSAPVWTFTPLTPTSISISSGNESTIQYTVRNTSDLSHTLVMTPIKGIKQITSGLGDCSNPFILGSQQSCILTLQVQGSALTGNVLGGPVVCQQGNSLQCYQPAETDSLFIHLIQTPPAQQYTVTPSSGSNGAISPNTVQEVAPGSTLSFTATPDTGYAVRQWLLDGGLVQTGGSSYQLSNIQANHLVSVNFAIQQFTISPSSGANGSISPGAPLVVNAGSTFPFTATPAAHYQVNQWRVDGIPVQSGGTSYLLSDIQANHTVSVDFILQEFIISPSAEANGSISPDVDQTVNYGSSLSFSATPNSGYTIYQWFLDEFVVQEGGSSYLLSTITGNHAVRVSFIQQFTITPSTEGNGSISPNTAQIVNSGAAVSFSATPGSGYGVNQWLLDGNPVQIGGNSYSLTHITANHAVAVSFSQTTLTPNSSTLGLSVSDSDAHPALTGNPRTLIISNTGSIDANNVLVDLPSFPSGTSVTANTCGNTLNAGSSCTITITPGSTVSTDINSNPCTAINSGDPVPSIITLTADNAPARQIAVLVLGYGCIYQGGYIFAVDDSTPASSSIGGKIAATTDQVPFSPGPGIHWSSDTTGQYGNVFSIYGIAETSTPLSPVPNSGQVSGQVACNGSTDGACNSNNIIVYYSLPNSNPPISLNLYASGICRNYAGGSYYDWYLPAICELGPEELNAAGCAANEQNIIDSLFGRVLSFTYWSATESSTDPLQRAWGSHPLALPHLTLEQKNELAGAVRCVRALTP